MEALVALIGKVDNLAILVSLAAMFGMGFLYRAERQECREDRKNTLEALNKNTEVLNRILNVLSASSGKPLL